MISGSGVYPRLPLARSYNSPNWRSTMMRTSTTKTSAPIACFMDPPESHGARFYFAPVASGQKRSAWLSSSFTFLPPGEF
jgi:hypothetical protein